MIAAVVLCFLGVGMLAVAAIATWGEQPPDTM